MTPDSTKPHPAAPSRADVLFDEYQLDIYRRTDRLFAWLMGFQWIAGIIFALWVSPLAWSGTVSTIHLHVWAAVVLGGLVSLFPALLAVLRPGQALHALHDRRRADADERTAHSPDRRTNRDPLSCLRVARVPRVLPRLARAGSSDGSGRARPHAARDLLAAIGVRRAGHEPVALGRARRLGHLRRRLPRRLLPPELHGDARACGTHRGPRTGSADPSACRERCPFAGGADVGGRPRPDQTRAISIACCRAVPKRWSRIWTMGSRGSGRSTRAARCSSCARARAPTPGSMARRAASPSGTRRSARSPPRAGRMSPAPGTSTHGSRDPDWAERDGIVAFAGYPLLVDSKLVGVMAILSRRDLSRRRSNRWRRWRTPSPSASSASAPRPSWRGIPAISRTRTTRNGKTPNNWRRSSKTCASRRRTPRPPRARRANSSPA